MDIMTVSEPMVSLASHFVRFVLFAKFTSSAQIKQWRLVNEGGYNVWSI